MHANPLASVHDRGAWHNVTATPGYFLLVLPGVLGSSFSLGNRECKLRLASAPMFANPSLSRVTVVTYWTQTLRSGDNMSSHDAPVSLLCY